MILCHGAWARASEIMNPNSAIGTSAARWRRASRGWMAALMLIPAAWAAHAAPARSLIPADGRIVLADYGIRDWGPEPVSYQIDLKAFPPGKLALLASDGSAVPFQIESNILTFVACVPKGGSAVYTLSKSATDRSSENTSLKTAEDKDGLQIGNEHLAILLPGQGELKPDEPAPAAQIQGPIKAWKPKGFDKWVGGSRFSTDRRIARAVFRLVRSGPAVCEYEARYFFSPRGEYVWRIQMAAGMPIARITEEFDAGEITDGRDLLMLELHRGWEPAHIMWTGQQPEGQNIAPVTAKPFSQYIEEKKKASPAEAPVGGAGHAPAPFVPEKGLVLLDRTVPAGKWGGYVGGAQLWEGDPQNPASGRNMAFVTLSVGSWRRTMALNAWHKEGSGLILGLPISVRRIRWSLDIADDLSLIHI